MAAECTSEDQRTTVEFDITVPDEFRGERLDRAAARLLAGGAAAASRTELAGAIRDGRATLDGRVVKPNATLAGGERLRGRWVREPRFDWRAAEPLALRIPYEDDHLLVVDKPAGLVVHPGAGNPRGTLVNGLLHHRPALAALPRAGLVHRLDKDTSGLLVVAAEAESQRRLAAMMSARSVQRCYLAVAEGRLIADARIDLAIGRDPRNRQRQSVRDDGRQAATRVAVRERLPAHTLVEATLETGRTHQVRVHLAAIGHPLVGDRRYGARGIVPRDATAAAADTIRGFPRQALHAWRLAFAHPASGEALAFESPVPADFACLLRALKA